MASKSVLFEQKYVLYIKYFMLRTYHIDELHSIKSSISFLVLSFDKLLMRI